MADLPIEVCMTALHFANLRIKFATIGQRIGHNFQGELTDISAEKEALVQIPW